MLCGGIENKVLEDKTYGYCKVITGTNPHGNVLTVTHPRCSTGLQKAKSMRDDDNYGGGRQDLSDASTVSSPRLVVTIKLPSRGT